MSQGIVVRTTKQVGFYPKGTELGFASPAKAEHVLGEGAFTVVSNADRSPIEDPAPSSKTSGQTLTLSKMNRSQLEAEADRLGVATDGLTSNKAFVEAIKVANEGESARTNNAAESSTE